MFKMNGRLQQIEEWTDYDEIVVSSLVLSNKLLKAIVEMVTPGRGRRFEMPKEKENIKILQKCVQGIDEVIESLKDARNVPAEARECHLTVIESLEQISIYCHWAFDDSDIVADSKKIKRAVSASKKFYERALRSFRKVYADVY